MNNITHNSSPSSVRKPVAFVQALFFLVLSLGAANPAVAAEGYPLINTLTGTFGDATDFMKSEVERLVEESGIEAAATQARTTLDGLAEGAVPMIDELKDPYQDNAEKAITKALDKVQLATEILNKFAGEGAKRTIDFIQNSPIFADADFGISTPTGRIRILRQGTEVSLCRTIVGPLGTVVITGISNAEQLCHYPDPRMHNPTKSLISFTYMAAGHTHIRSSHVLIPNLAEDLTLLPAPIDATTYVKTIGDQWVQIRLAGSDPKSMEIEAKFEVGLKANYSYIADVEAEGEAALKLSLKPLYAAEIIRSTGEAMFNKATELGLDMDVANLPSNTANILKAGLDHLSEIEPEYEDGFGNVIIDVKITGGIGVGAWDSAISAVSANSTLTLTYPLVELIELRAGLLGEYLDVAMAMVEVNMNLGTSALEGKPDFDAFLTGSKQASNDFVNGVMQELLDASAADDFTMESTLTLSVLGDADKESIEIYQSGLVLPIGKLSASLQNNSNALGDAYGAAAYLLLASVDPTAEITEQTWIDLEKVVVPGIEYTLRVLNPYTFTLVGFQNVDLLDSIKNIAFIRNILASVVTSSFDESIADLRTAIEAAINSADDQIIAMINQAKIERSTKIGANGALGAELVAELGASIELKGEVNASLFLLLLDMPIYQIPGDPEKPEERGLLASASMPVNFSLDVGASAGEGVELTVDAGGTLGLNLFELTVKHWEDKLPTAALMKVAGFSVLEFDDGFNQDGSFSGNGYLMLPMGGIVNADFAVDEFGNVTSGTWSGGLELGPLGDFPFIEGTLDNDGLHGSINVALLGSSFNADFILNSSGLLLGSYNGDITIGGHELLAANLYIGTDGQFVGHYNGDLSIGGFVATSVLDFNNDGFSGSSELTLFGSGLTSNDIGITRSGVVSGTFTGEIIAGPHTLSNVSLQAVNGGFIGSAMMDLPGLPGAMVELRVFDGKVTAYYQGELFNGLVSQASFEITASGIVMSANFNTSQFPNISSQVLNLVVDAAAIAEGLLSQAEDNLVTAQNNLVAAEEALNAASAELTAQLEAAQQKVLDATAAAQTALQELNVVIAEIDKIINSYQVLINNALKLRNDTKAAYDNAVNLVNYYNRKISDLDRWYNGLSAYNKAKYLAYYTGQRTKLLGYRTTAIANRTATYAAYIAAQEAYDILVSERDTLLSPLTVSKAALQITYDQAAAVLQTAEQELAQLEADIIADTTLQPLYEAIELARAALTQAQQTVDELNGTITMAAYFAAEGADAAFAVLSANVTADLNTLMSSSSFEIEARVTFLGQQGLVKLDFDPADPVNSFHQLVTSLQTGVASISNVDVTAPTVIANQPAEWASNQTLIQLIAEDNAGGSGIASITYSATGAQLLSEISVAGKEAFALIETEGLTSLSFFTTDLNGNVSETTTISINIDNSGPQISVTPSGINEGVYEVMINAKDLLGSGIEYIAVSASGAEYFNESISLTDEVIITLSEEGITTLTITAVDIAGNTTTITRELTVPKLFTDSGEPIHTIDTGDSQDDSSGGGALGLLSMLFALMVIYFRNLSTHRSRQVKL